MGINERVDNYYGRTKDILQHMGNHHPRWFPCAYIYRQFYLMELQTYVKEGAIATYVQAYTQAKTWEECWLKNELAI